MTVLRYSEVFGSNKGIYNIDLNHVVAYCFEEAEKSQRKRCLLLLHEGDYETGHRFINALLPDTELSIHRHMSKLQTELYLPLVGRAVVVSFTDKGEIDTSIVINSCEQSIVEIKPQTWHTIIPLTYFAMFEMKGQPQNYDPAKDKEFAPWAPKEGEKGFREYLDRIKKKVLR